MKLLPSELCLTGKWQASDEGVIADDVCLRIEALIHSHLRELASDRSGWDTLFVDPADGRLWELVYPDSDHHGGGAPTLRHVSTELAVEKYGSVAAGSR